MLLASTLGSPPAVLYGFGALPTTHAGLKKLQEALVKLSEATHNAAINPGATDGVLTDGLPSDRTMVAISSSMGLITPHIPKWAAIPIVIAFGVGASTDTARKAVVSYADPLTTAVKAATVAAPFYVKAPTAEPASEIPAIFQTSGPWYATWWGIGAIAVGVLGTLSLVAAHRRAP